MKKRVKTRQKKLKRKDTIKKYDKKLTKRNNRKLIRTKKNKTKRNKTKRNKIRINNDNLKGGDGKKERFKSFFIKNKGKIKNNAFEIAKIVGEEAIKLSPGGSELVTLVNTMVDIKKNKPPVRNRLDLIEAILNRITQELIFKGVMTQTELERPGVSPRPNISSEKDTEPVTESDIETDNDPVSEQDTSLKTNISPPASPASSPEGHDII